MSKFPHGAKPTPKEERDAATKHRPAPGSAVPLSFLMWPVQMNPWGNYGLGDCVTAEEAFCKATASPQVFFSQKNVVNWARAHGYAQGAYLTTVMRTMQTSGFVTNGKRYDDGKFEYVDYTNEATLAAACFAHGPVKLGVAGDDLENIVPGGVSGWIGQLPKNTNEDHCISLCGYGWLGDLKNLFAEHGVSVTIPSGQPTTLSYAVFTWDSIGIIDQQTLLNICGEAWVRVPPTIVA